MALNPAHTFKPLVSYEVPLIARLDKPEIPYLVGLFQQGVAVALWPGEKKRTFVHLTALCAEYGFLEAHVFVWKRIPNPEAYLVEHEISASFQLAQKRAS